IRRPKIIYNYITFNSYIISMGNSHTTNSDEDIINAAAQKQIHQEALADRLRAEGHQCVTILESYPIKVMWCGSFNLCTQINVVASSDIILQNVMNDTTYDNLNITDDDKDRKQRIQIRKEDFVDRLRAEGHQCITI